MYVLAALLLFFEFVVTCRSLKEFFTFLGDSSVDVIFLVELLDLSYCFGIVTGV